MINQPLHNRGDESAHKGLLRALLKQIPNASIDVIIFNDDEDTINQFNVQDKRVKYYNFVPSVGYSYFFKITKLAVENDFTFLYTFFPDLKRLTKYYKQADYVLCAPGGISMGGFQNREHLYALHYAKHFQKPLAYFGRSFGPFPTENKSQRRYKKFSEDILHYFSYLSIRDKETEKLATKMNLQYYSTVDSAFLDSPRVSIPQDIQNEIGKKYIVFVPNILIWHYNYKNRITKEAVLSYFSQMVRILISKYPGHKVVMLPQTFNYKDELRDDINFFYELKRNVNAAEIVVLSDQYSSDLQQTIISNAACVVGARYHSVVFSLNNKVPFVALNYEHKIKGLLEALGKQDCMLDIVHALDSQSNMAESLCNFEILLDKVSADSLVREKAKDIAEKGLNLLVNDIIDKTK